MSNELCQRCEETGEDHRTLYMKCMYDMSEFKVPFTLKDGEFYILRVCKDCRADWLMAIEHWFSSKPKYVTYTERLKWEPPKGDLK